MKKWYSFTLYRFFFKPSHRLFHFYQSSYTKKIKVVRMKIGHKIPMDQSM